MSRDPEKQRAAARKSYQKHRKKVREKQAARYRVDIEVSRARGRQAAKKYRDDNPGSNTAAVRKYRHGWTALDVENQLIRQQRSCAGCLLPIDRSAHLDHDHETGRIRGLLCPPCNLALGQLRDNPATLRRLMAYLDRDISKTFIYLIGALKNQRIPDVGNLLRAANYDVMDEWFTPGEFADSNWQEYSRRRGLTFVEALRGRAATNIFLFDRSYLDISDIVVLVMPAGKSAMLELGYAKGRGKKTVIFLDGADPDRYDIMPNFADAVCLNEEELLAVLTKFSPERRGNDGV